MAQLSPQDQADVVEAYHADFGGPEFTQIAQRLQDYPNARMMLEEDRVRKTSGTKIQRPVFSKKGPKAQTLGMYGLIDPTVTDHSMHVTSHWTRSARPWSWEDWEIITATTGNQIFDMLEMRQQDAMLGMVELIEDEMFEIPTVGDNLSLLGYPIWFVYNGTDGFTGGAATGHTLVGGVDISVHDTFKNYNVTYTNVTEDDFIAKLLKATVFTGWKSPVTKEDFLSPRGRDFLFQTDYDTKAALVAALRLRNDQLGFDVSKGYGEDNLFGHRIWYVPKFNELSGNPIMGINRQFMEFHVQAGGELKTKEFPQWSKQPTTNTKVLVFHYGMVCTDRRAQLMAAKSDPFA
jgi:hypothetical protein